MKTWLKKSILKKVQFSDQGKISPALEASIDHPFFLEVVKNCLRLPNQKDMSEYQEDFFSETNSEFVTLSTLLNSDVNNEPISLQEMKPSILAAGLSLIDKGKLIKILSSSDYENCTSEQIAVLVTFLLEHNFLHYAFVFVKSSFTRFELYNCIYNVFPFIFFFIEKIVMDENIPMAQKFAKINTEDLRQLLSIAPNFLFHPKYNRV